MERLEAIRLDIESAMMPDIGNALESLLELLKIVEAALALRRWQK